MKILWHSNAPWSNTGYGVETRVFCPRIAALGHDLTISAFYGLQGASLSYKDVLVLPNYADPFGNDVIRAHAQFLDVDIVLTLMDCWVLNPAKMITLPWAAWLPVDHNPAPPPTVNTLRNAKATPIAFSRFGERMLKDAELDPVFYVPHSPEAIFYKEVDRMEAKAKFGWEDNFVIGMVAANKGYPSRKSFPQVFEAVAKFIKNDQRKNVILYLHTESRSPWGVRLDTMLEHYGVPHDNVRFVDQYRYVVGMGSEYMVDAYNAMDVLVNPSMGEGFGIPIIEAQACGTPVIVTNWTSMPELCFFGEKVGGTKWYTSQASWQMIPNTNQIFEALRKYYNMSKSRRQKGSELARRKALEYHPDYVTKHYWEPVLEQINEIMQKRDDIEYSMFTLTEDVEDHKIGMD